MSAGFAPLLSEREREIAGVRRLDGVHFYDLLQVRTGARNRRVMGILVFYDSGRILNYTQSDAEFDALLKKLLYQYHLEKGDRPIEADAFSRRILETGAVDLAQSSARHYRGQPGYEHSLFPFAAHRYEPVRAVAEYLLQRLFAVQQQPVRIAHYTGYRERIALHLSCCEKMYVLPVRLCSRGDSGAELSVGNLPGGVHRLHMQIAFGDGYIQAGWHDPDGTLSLHAEYRLGAAGLHIDEQVFSAGKLQTCRTELQREPFRGPELAAARALWRADGSPPDGPAFRLPWGGLLLRGEREERLDSRYIQTVSDTAYLMLGGDFAVMRQHCEKGLRARGDPLYLRTDAAVKSMTVRRVGRYGVAQTHFHPSASALGEYKRELAGRYFYSLLKADDGLEALEEVALRPVGEEDDVRAGYQLLDEATLHNLWEGDGGIG